MSPELDQKLCEAFPLLYANRHGSPRETCMCWGFECGDGWFDVIWKASQKLESILQALPEDERFRAAQIKEKFGGLRLYLDGPSTPEAEEIIREAEALASQTCEDCGQPGSVDRSHPWVRTLCDEHKASRPR